MTFDGTEILQAEVDEFHNSEVGVSAYRRENWDPELFDDRILNLRTKMPFTIGDFEDRFKNLVTTGVYLITLPNQLHVTITGGIETDFNHRAFGSHVMSDSETETCPNLLLLEVWTSFPW